MPSCGTCDDRNPYCRRCGEPRPELDKLRKALEEREAEIERLKKEAWKLKQDLKLQEAAIGGYRLLEEELREEISQAEKRGYDRGMSSNREDAESVLAQRDARIAGLGEALEAANNALHDQVFKMRAAREEGWREALLERIAELEKELGIAQALNDEMAFRRNKLMEEAMDDGREEGRREAAEVVWREFQKWNADRSPDVVAALSRVHVQLVERKLDK